MLASTQSVDLSLFTQIRVGTINELLGIGEEWLVDRMTRSCVLVRFLNGQIITINMGCPTQDESLAPTKVAA